MLNITLLLENNGEWVDDFLTTVQKKRDNDGEWENI